MFSLARIAVFSLGLFGASSAWSYSLAPAGQLPVEGDAVAVVTADVNGDGRDDVVALSRVAPGSFLLVNVFVQDGQGTLSPQAAVVRLSSRVGLGLATADLDGDGRDEVVVGLRNGIGVVRWTGLPKSPLDLKVHDHGVEIGHIGLLDVNRDGHLDVFAQDLSGYGYPGEGPGSLVFLGDGKAGFGEPYLIPDKARGSLALEVGDFNSDGFADVAVLAFKETASNDAHLIVFFNNGEPRMSSPLVFDPGPGEFYVDSLGSGDFDSDGRLDLAVHASDHRIAVYYQQDHGFAPPQLLETGALRPQALAGRDLDHDDRDDLLVLQNGGRLGVHPRTDNGFAPEQVTEPSNYLSWFQSNALATGYVTGDACTDAVVANRTHGVAIYAGLGCEGRPDIVPHIDLTRHGVTRIIVTLIIHNQGALEALEPAALLELRLDDGDLAVGPVPEDCEVISEPVVGMVRIGCALASLAEGASIRLEIPFTISGGTATSVRAKLHRVLRAEAIVESTSPTEEQSNNRVSTSLRLD